MARVKKIWHLFPHDEAAIQQLAHGLQLSPIVAQLLLNRGVTTPEEAQRFLQIPMSGLHEPELMPGIPEAARRIYAAVQEKRPICIYGDYDVDGVTGTAILFTLLSLLGANVQFHVPHRVEEGYGLNTNTLQQIADGGISLVVTVDCGIASVKEAEEARKLGLELIITDHHEFKSQLPQADVLVHPRLEEGKYPFESLSGSGVAFKLAWALCKVASGGDKVTPRFREFLLNALVWASFGTVADVMPLLGENRILVKHGLARLQSQPGEGLQALLRSSKLGDKSELTATDIAFILAPRLNAAGRMGSARVALDLLLSKTPQQAEDLARGLEESNQERQKQERRILYEARQMIEQSDHLDKPALVLAHSQWHRGLIGIVAGRLSDTYARPALMIAAAKGEDIAVGSGRSIPGFALHKALQACSSHLLTHGGHAAAAGFKLRATSIQTFRDSFCEVATEHFTDGIPEPHLMIDAEVPLSVLTMGLVQAIARLEPYGAGNPQPVFLADNIQIVGEPRKVGNDRHLSFRVRQEGQVMRGIAFNMADRLDELMSEGGRCCFVFTPQINEWQGVRSVQLQVRDFQPGGKAQLG